MLTVTKIEEISGSRSKVFTDDGFAFVLYKGELRLYGIAEGEEISEAAYHVIIEEVLTKRAKLRAMKLLKNRDYTVKQLRDKLKEGGYPERASEAALDYVAEYRYTDDLRYAVAYISTHENDRSRRRIEHDLQTRGIDKATMERAWAEWEKEGGSQNELAMISSLLEKRHYDPDTADWKEQQKTYAFLMRKGFSGEQIRRAMKTSETDFERF